MGRKVNARLLPFKQIASSIYKLVPPRLARQRSKRGKKELLPPPPPSSSGFVPGKVLIAPFCHAAFSRPTLPGLASGTGGIGSDSRLPTSTLVNVYRPSFSARSHIWRYMSDSEYRLFNPLAPLALFSNKQDVLTVLLTMSLLKFHKN